MNIENSLLHQKIKSLIELSEEDTQLLFGITKKITAKKGEMLLLQHTICRRIFFVEKGYLRIFSDRNGHEINTDFIFEASFATNLKSLRQGTPSEVSILAAENAELWVFDKDQLMGLYGKSSGIASFGRKLLEELLEHQEEHANLFKLYSPKERYHLLMEKRPEIIQRVSQTQIASYLGIARETLSRLRKQ